MSESGICKICQGVGEGLIITEWKMDGGYTIENRKCCFCGGSGMEKNKQKPKIDPERLKHAMDKAVEAIENGK